MERQQDRSGSQNCYCLIDFLRQSPPPKLNLIPRSAQWHRAVRSDRFDSMLGSLTLTMSNGSESSVACRDNGAMLCSDGYRDHMRDQTSQARSGCGIFSLYALGLGLKSSCTSVDEVIDKSLFINPPCGEFRHIGRRRGPSTPCAHHINPRRTVYAAATKLSRSSCTAEICKTFQCSGQVPRKDRPESEGEREDGTVQNTVTRAV